VTPNPGTVTKNDNSYLAADNAAGPIQTGEIWHLIVCPFRSVTLTNGVDTIKVCTFVLCLGREL